MPESCGRLCRRRATHCDAMSDILWLSGRRILRADGSQTCLTDEACILLAISALSPWRRWRFLRRLTPAEVEMWRAIWKADFGHLSADVGQLLVLP